MQTLFIEPGDGTRYRVAFSALTPEQSKANYVGEEGFFFAFGLGNEPVAGYFFTRGQQFSQEYVTEKFWDAGRMPYIYAFINLCLHIVAGSDVAQFARPSETVQEALARLNDGWDDDLQDAVFDEFNEVNEFEVDFLITKEYGL